MNCLSEEINRCSNSEVVLLSPFSNYKCFLRLLISLHPPSANLSIFQTLAMCRLLVVKGVVSFCFSCGGPYFSFKESITICLLKMNEDIDLRLSWRCFLWRQSCCSHKELNFLDFVWNFCNVYCFVLRPFSR